MGGIGIVRYRKFYALIYINNSQAINHLMQTFMAEIQNRLCWNWFFWFHLHLDSESLEPLFKTWLLLHFINKNTGELLCDCRILHKLYGNWSTSKRFIVRSILSFHSFALLVPYFI